MVGRERRVDYYQETRQIGGKSARCALEGIGLSLVGAFRNVSLSVHEGEVVGVGGLLNSGKSRLGRSIAGLARSDAGTLRVAGNDVTADGLRQRVAKGVGYVPAERLVEGVIAPYTIAWNTGLASGDSLTGRLGVWDDRAENAAARKNIARFNIRADGPDQICSTLSGGNQQKVVLGRWAYRSPRVLVLDNPTRGVDAGGKEEIYRILRDLAAAGVGILLITDDLLELIGLSDRILIMSDGRIAGEVLSPPEAKPGERDLVQLMLGSGVAVERGGQEIPRAAEVA
jgi:ABC-type sugar transport system ATPase subunit